MTHDTPAWRRLLAVALASAGVTVGCGAAAQHHRLTAGGMEFQPAEIVVASGDTLTWTNRDIVPHTVTGVDASWGSGELAAEGAFTLVAIGPDTIHYECAYHPTMTGTIVVR